MSLLILQECSELDLETMLLEGHPELSSWDHQVLVDQLKLKLSLRSMVLSIFVQDHYLKMRLLEIPQLDKLLQTV
jgi:hypothetical protein